jgi:hypothetical protein
MMGGVGGGVSKYSALPPPPAGDGRQQPVIGDI